MRMVKSVGKSLQNMRMEERDEEIYYYRGGT